MTLGFILTRIRPGSLWSLDGDDLAGLSWNGPGSAPTQQEIDEARASLAVEVAWENVRSIRDRLLAASDWTQIADAPVDAAAWAVYRQALRDIPQDYATPDAVVWPEQP